jgi:hypothetical protein
VPVGTKISAEIVGGDEKDVRTRARGGGGRCRNDGETHEGEEMETKRGHVTGKSYFWRRVRSASIEAVHAAAAA